MSSFPWFALASMAEIAGCFAFWAWLRLDKSALWLVPGVLLLLAFAWVLTRVDVDRAGRGLCCLRRRLHCRVAGLAVGH